MSATIYAGCICPVSYTHLTGGEAEVKLNGLDLSGPNKRVELDDRSKLSIVLMENTESVMR